jgi:hypothetical protein
MRAVPRISEFYGIVIWMYRPDHAPEHFHAQYGAMWAQLAIADLRVLNGRLPPRALRLVRVWAAQHSDELAEDWRRAQAREDLLPIAPLP